MSRADYGGQKRQREAERARRQQEKMQRRLERRDRGPTEIPVVSAAELMGSMPSSEEALQQMEERSKAPRAASGVPARLFVGGVGPRVTQEMLRQTFAAFGPVADVFVPIDRATGSPRGFAFVTMADRRDAVKAIEGLHGSDLDGRSLVVNVATERGGR